MRIDGSPTYLLVTHVRLGRGSRPDAFRLGDMWLEDLKGEAAAVRAAGMRLVIATPCVPNLSEGAGGSFHSVEIRPQDHDFDYVPLPAYQSMGSYLRVRGAMRRALREVIAGADIVQMGYGGHPVPLGAVAWPIARALGRRRIWVFDGGDPFPQWRFAADQTRNTLKRVARRLQLRWFHHFCRRAITEADLVFAHNNSVVQRFADVWGPHCYRFDRSFVTDDVLISDAELSRRRQFLLDRAGPLRLVAAGRQISIKGTDQLLRAVARARAKGARLELDVYGDGPQLPDYRALADELGLAQVVRFHGSVPYGQPLFDALSPQHAMVVTNLTSEFSRSLLLAMARGLPLITYSNPADGLVEPNGAGVVVPMGNEAAMAEALVEADRDRERLADLAEAGLRLARATTLGACHRRRAELAAAIVRGQRPWAPEARMNTTAPTAPPKAASSPLGPAPLT